MEPQHPTILDFRLRLAQSRARLLAEQEDDLFHDLAHIRDERQAIERIIRALGGQADTARHVLYVDGASRGHPRSAAAGYVLVDPASGASKEGAKALGALSCNEAEFAALVVGLEAALAAGISRLEVRSDSSAVVRAMRGEHTIRARNLRLLYERAVELANRFETVTFKHIPRTENGRADKLASGALAKPGRRAA